MDLQALIGQRVMVTHGFSILSVATGTLLAASASTLTLSGEHGPRDYALAEVREIDPLQ